MDSFSQLLNDFLALMEAKSGDLSEGIFPELASATAISSELAIDKIAENAVANFEAEMKA